MSSDEEDFVFYGTPIEREEEITTRKKKAVAEASGQLRTALAPWKQEATDEEGRRRFHGAFTGGFSAGYYNTVGSKEGWTPQSFTSSRKNRTEVQQQSIYNFMDEDEKSELEGRSLEMSMQFDTFGFTAAELARKQAEKEQQQRPSTIPGPVPDELIVPSTESIGVKLLLKMGWRQGRSIKDANRNSLYDVRREARKAFLALSSEQPAGLQLDEDDAYNVPDLPTNNNDLLFKSTPAFVLNPKQDLYGLGYDPFKQAPEFREKKRQQLSGHRDMQRNMSLSMKGKVGPGFGIGALEDLDAEDEDIYAPGYDFQDTYVQEIEEPSGVKTDILRISDRKKRDVLLGFEVASTSDSQFERFDPPKIPGDFVPHHKFSAPLGHNGISSEIPPPEAPPPEDNNLKVCIEGVATFVDRCGKLFEELLRDKNQANPLFGFLSGGNGCEYYARKLWEMCQKRAEHRKLRDEKTAMNSEKLTAERRGKILGEQALESSSKDSSSVVASESIGTVNMQFNLSDTFTRPVSVNGHPDMTKPFSDDPAKQKRYKQFLKEKYEGGLRTKDSGGSSYMSESDRARERLEFEAAVEATEKGHSVKENNATKQLLAELSGAAGLQFTTGGVENKNAQQDRESIMKGMYPRREQFQWRPAPILCKRFDLIDPYMGKPPPAPRVKSKMDSLIFMPDTARTQNVEKHVAKELASSSTPQKDSEKLSEETTEKEESLVAAQNVERPVDLYKAIFSDDSEDEVENSTPNQVDDTQKKIEVANATLNRLIAGDFLETLGKELGLLVPPDLHKSENKVVNVDRGSEDSPFAQKIRPNTENGERTRNISDHEKFDASGVYASEISGTLVGGKERPINVPEENSNVKTDRTGPGSSSEYRRRRKYSSSKSKSRSRSSDSDSSSESDDYRGRYSSSSKRKEKRSSREGNNSSRKRHSEHHKHRRKGSPKRSHRSSGTDYEDRKRKKHSKYEK